MLGRCWTCLCVGLPDNLRSGYEAPRAQVLFDSTAVVGKQPAFGISILPIECRRCRCVAGATRIDLASHPPHEYMQYAQPSSCGTHPGHNRGRTQHRKHAYSTASTCAREQTQQHAAAAVQSSRDCQAQRKRHGVPCRIGASRCGRIPQTANTRGPALSQTHTPGCHPPPRLNCAATAAAVGP
jgi:hypothetical protein